jgi:sugar phosphate isomerase/epimerase
MNEVLVPYWHKSSEIALSYGVKKICLELHPGMTVFNPYTFFDLQQKVGDAIYANLDPSHLFWQGMDPMAVVELLGERIGFVHAKDTILDPRNIGRNGVLDPRWPTEARNMPWYFTTMGYGHDHGFWKAFMLKLREHGYNGMLSIEHECLIVEPKEAVIKTVDFLREVYIAN